MSSPRLIIFAARERKALVIPALLLSVLAASLLFLEGQGNNNCCYRPDWNCQTDDEWNAGYYAFQRNECPASTSDSASEQISNCCDTAGWNCQTNNDWTDGWYAYRRDQCAAPQNSNRQSAPPQYSQEQIMTATQAYAEYQATLSAWEQQYQSQSEGPEAPKSAQGQQQDNNAPPPPPPTLPPPIEPPKEERGGQQNQGQGQGQAQLQQAQSTEAPPPVQTQPPIHIVKTPVKVVKEGDTTKNIFDDGSVITFRPLTEEEWCEALDDCG